LLRKKELTRDANPGFISAMKRKTSLISLAVWLAAGAVCFANPNMGTWKLNAAKSKLGRDMGRNETVRYEWDFFKIKVTIDGTDAKGKPAHSEWVGNFDGKDYPVTGDATSDARSYKKVNDYTTDFEIKKGGKVTLKGRIAVAADGKSRTVTVWGRGHKGRWVKRTAVYDRV
jgi:hypothetical protein